MVDLTYLPIRRLCLSLAVLLWLAAPAAAWAPSARLRPGKASAARGAGNPAARARPAHNSAGKIAVFPFQDDDDHSVSAQVERLLRARGFEVVTGVRPVDTAEQFRELASTLSLAALVGGSYDEGAEKSRVTVQVLSGYTGRRLVAVTFKETRLHLRAQVEGKLWSRIGPAMARARADAAKPRKRGRAPLVIEAGTSLASSREN
jgi:TolB-like protein